MTVFEASTERMTQLDDWTRAFSAYDTFAAMVRAGLQRQHRPTMRLDHYPDFGNELADAYDTYMTAHGHEYRMERWPHR